VTVPAGLQNLSDVLASSPIISADGVVPMTGGDDFEFGVDPTLDPELALALRISMEEERARQGVPEEAAPMETEDDELAKALAMSVQGEQSTSTTGDAYMNSVLQSLPGVDPNDPRIKNAMKQDKSPKKNDKK